MNQNKMFMGIKWDNLDIEPNLKQIAFKNTIEFIDYLDVKDILEISSTRGKPKKEILTIHQWQKLTGFVKSILDKFIQTDDETSILYNEMIEILCNERLHLKSFEEN